MDLQKNTLQCYQQVLDLTHRQEETLEAIVPDACPDIAGIVAVNGQICLGEKQVSEGQISITGQIDATILYKPEEGGVLQKMTVRLPYKTQLTADQLTQGDELFVIPSLLSGDARILNPRKILVRVEFMLDLSGFHSHSLSLSCGVEGAAAQHIQEKCTSTEIRPLATVQSKHFTFDETLPLQGSGELVDVLSLRLFPSCTESKLIGNKLIFKGETDVQIMYRDDQDQLVHSRHTLPFSQIMEVEDFGASSHSSVLVVLESYYANPTLDGGRSIEITIDCLAQATVRGETHLELLEDAYSTTHHLSVEKEQYTLVTVADEFTVPLPQRQIFETDTPVQLVEDSWISTSNVTQTREGEQLTFSCNIMLSLLCRNEEGDYHTLEFTQTLEHPTTAPLQTVCCCRCLCGGEVFATPAPGGIELRYTPQFFYSFVEGSPVTVVVSATQGELREKTSSSVVLRLPQVGEHLWDIAKSYGTTTSQIIAANQLEDDLPLGQMLLIPSMR